MPGALVGADESVSLVWPWDQGLPWIDRICSSVPAVWSWNEKGVEVLPYVLRWHPGSFLRTGLLRPSLHSYLPRLSGAVNEFYALLSLVSTKSKAEVENPRFERKMFVLRLGCFTRLLGVLPVVYEIVVEASLGVLTALTLPLITRTS